jgi:K+-transporting ATPase ATPase C chain
MVDAMLDAFLVALRTTAVTLVLTGLVYPFAITALAQLLFPFQANGSLVTDERGVTVGSELIGQKFASPAYFQLRPSVAGGGYDASSSAAANYGVTSAKLRDRVTAEAARLAAANPEAPGPIPGDLLTASASGLDPDLSPEAARWQIPRVARARHVEAARVSGVLESLVEGRDLGLLGEPRVNVLLLNLALDRQFGRPEAMAATP